MNKYKIYVYAICKNEELFVDRWYNSMKEADGVYVLDTGSTDNTVQRLKEHGVNITTKVIDPWRFDVARNESLKLIPSDADICVCTDLDEVFNVGWRNELEKVWNDNTNRCKYIYNWSLDGDGKPLVSFYYEKIHSLNGYRWIYPVHEVLDTKNEENYVVTDKIVLNHYPDKNKSRSNYLKLLELSVKENPDNDRNMHYLGREYMYRKMWNNSIDTLIRHLNLKSATWKDERCASMRFISRCYINLRRYDEAYMWLNKAIDEAPYLRDPYIEKALLDYNLENYLDMKNNCLKVLDITYHEKTYINEVFSWDNTVYDLLSIACFHLKEYEESLKYVDKAIEMNHDDQRLSNNRLIILDKINKK